MGVIILAAAELMAALRYRTRQSLEIVLYFLRFSDKAGKQRITDLKSAVYTS